MHTLDQIETVSRSHIVRYHRRKRQPFSATLGDVLVGMVTDSSRAHNKNIIVEQKKWKTTSRNGRQTKKRSVT